MNGADVCRLSCNWLPPPDLRGWLVDLIRPGRCSSFVSNLIRSALLLACIGRPLQAQEARPPAGDCPEGRISFILIDNNSIFDTTDPDLDARFRWVYAAANSLHVKTRQWVIRRELLFRTGDCYDPFLLAESERLLRGYPFLARVNIYGVDQPDGSHHVIIDSHDEWSTRFDVRFRVDNGFRFEGVRLSEVNFLGMGQALGVFWQEREVTRDYGVSYWSPQIGRSLWDLSASLGRTRAGWFARETIAYPFLGEIGHWAGRESLSRDDQFFDYIVRDDAAQNSPHVLRRQRENLFEAALLRRFGDRGRAVLAGVGLTWHELDHTGTVEVAPNGDFDERMPADSADVAAIAMQGTTRRAVRLHALLGLRDVRWIKKRGMDSMRGEEDVRLGFELGGDIGRSLAAFGDDDLALATIVYAAGEAGGALFIGRARLDGLYTFRTAPTESAWQDIVADAESFLYFRASPASRHTLLLRSGLAAARNTRTPFQLTLGGESGVRGYGRERFPGGRRAVVTIEDRIYIGWPLRDVWDSGLTLFADAGRVWPGDVPYGMDSGWQASAGAGLRFSFPADSRTTYRLDFAWPIGGGHSLKDVQFRFTLGELIGIVNANSNLQFRRSRTEGVAADLFRHSSLAGS